MAVKSKSYCYLFMRHNCWPPIFAFKLVYFHQLQTAEDMFAMDSFLFIIPGDLSVLFARPLLYCFLFRLPANSCLF